MSVSLRADDQGYELLVHEKAHTMKNVTDQPEITQTVQEGIDRFGELIEEYKRMKGVHGDQLRLAAYDLYAGILTDGIHYAETFGIDFTLAFGEAYKTALQERSA